MKKVLVLTDDMPWGHRSIAKAIYNYLKDKEKEAEIRVDYAAVKQSSDVANDLYTFIYRFFPKTGKLAYKIMKNESARNAVKELAMMNLPQLKKTINRYKPDLVISCYFFHSQTLAMWKEKEDKQFKLWTVVADPWTINPISFVPGADLHLVYDDVGEKEAIRMGVDKGKVLKTGWWVRPQMYRKARKSESRGGMTPPVQEVRNNLGFSDDRPVVFIGGGSLGTSSLAKFLPVLLFVKKRVGIVFNTGTDKLAFQLVEKYKRLLRNLKRDDKVQIKTLGWIDNMAEVLSACDIVFGKAGPNFLFDVVAVEKPFVAITHIGGQEDGNIEIIKKKKLGWVKEKNGKLAKFFVKYLANPGYYNQKFEKTIHEEAVRNKGSLERVWQRIREELV